MKSNIPLILSFLFSVLSFTTVISQDVEFTASAEPDVLTAGEQFSIIFSSNERIDDVTVPELPDFQFLGGPIRSESRSVRMTGGKVTSVAEYQYVLYYMALKEGRFTIPAATARIGNREYKSNPVVLQVAAGRNMQADPGGESGQAAQASDIDRNNLFIRLIPDKTDAFIGEPVELTVKLYTRVDLTGYDPGFKGPDLQGFFTEVESSPGTITREVYNNVVYNTAIIRKYYAIPQKTGEIIIQPFSIDVGVRREVSRRITDPFFDEFFFPEIEEVPVTLMSGPVRINIKQLPPGAPSGFTGAVGKFNIASSLNLIETNVNEPVTLKYSVTGTGNIKLVNEIRTEIPPDLEAFEPVVGTTMEGPVRGTRSFEYMLIPHAPGTYLIPEVTFTYFDPDKETYSTVYSESYTVNVTGTVTNMGSNNGILRNEVEVLNNDIRYIKLRNIRLRTSAGSFAGSPLYFIIVLLILATFASALIIRRKFNIRESDVAGVRKRKADKYAAKRLKNSHQKLIQGKATEFYDELLSALWKFVADKFNIPMAKLSRETAKDALISVTDDTDLIESFFRVTEECEMARYSQNTGTTEPETLYRDAVEIISRIQQKIKKG